MDALKQLKRTARATMRTWGTLAEANGAAQRLMAEAYLCGRPFAVEVVPARAGRFKVQPFGAHLRQHRDPVRVCVVDERCLLCASEKSG